MVLCSNPVNSLLVVSDDVTFSELRLHTMVLCSNPCLVNSLLVASDEDAIDIPSYVHGFFPQSRCQLDEFTQ